MFPCTTELFSVTVKLTHLWPMGKPSSIFFTQFQYYYKIFASLAFVPPMLQFLVSNTKISTYVFYHTI